MSQTLASASEKSCTFWTIEETHLIDCFKILLYFIDKSIFLWTKVSHRIENSFGSKASCKCRRNLKQQRGFYDKSKFLPFTITKNPQKLTGQIGKANCFIFASFIPHKNIKPFKFSLGYDVAWGDFSGVFYGGK